MNEIWFFLLALLAVPYFLVPILIRRNHYFAEQPRLRPVGAFLPEPVESYFRKSTSALAKLGFSHRLDVVSLDFGPSIRVFMRLFVDQKRSFVAMCSSLMPDGKSAVLNNFVEFCSRYADGYEVSTHNSDLTGAPIEHRHKITTSLPKITNVEILLAVHERTITKLNFHHKKTIVPDEGAELSYLIENFRNDLLTQANLGCLVFDETNKCYRPTWAGAFLMGWYSMWPIGPIMRLWQKCRAKIKLHSSSLGHAR